MKKQFLWGLFLACCTLSASGAETAGHVNFSFKTKAGTSKHEPNHCLAIWVTDSQGDVVKTLQVNAKKHKKHLLTWLALPVKNDVDAITSATLKQHQRQNIQWDCRDTDGNVVPDGTYQFHVELTARNKQGPVTQVEFVKGKTDVSLQPADFKQFESINLSYTPDA